MHYCFDRIDLQVDKRQLLVDGAPAPLGARAFDMLVALIERRERVVSKTELLDLVWRDVVVEESNLQVQISNLRKILGPQAIATIPGRGYRFVSTIVAGGPATPRAPATSGVIATTDAGTAPQRVPDAVRPGSRSNLPARLPTLYGRAGDAAQVRELLAPHRVVSIVASSGIGKTRLAQAVAGALHERFSDGVWWVDLAPLAEGELVAAELARVLGVELAAGRPALDLVVDVLRRQSLLLLLDNCEHLLPAVTAVVDAIVGGAPGVRVLVTSQEPLKIPEEQVFRLNTLALPAHAGLEEAERSGAVQLFVGRVRAVDPRFALTAANADKAVAICRRLDGIPLALELAAARVPLLGLDGLHARLDERFRILTGGSRFVLRRHQTLRAALDFSHGLLTPEEKAVFRRIGVFARSFSAETAQDAVADATIDRWAVLDHLGALADKSMVLAEAGDRPRLRLLETARAYALEKLGDAGETAALLERHARAMAQLVASLRHDYWHTPDDVRAERQTPELDNLRAALGWALKHDEALALSIAGDAGMLWIDFDLQPEGARYCEQALAHATEAMPALALGRAWHALSALVNFTQPARSRLAALRAAQYLRRTEDAATLAMSLMLTTSRTGAPDAQALAALEELRTLDQRLRAADAPPLVRAQCALATARATMGAGRHAEARGQFAAVAALLAGSGNVQWELAAEWGVGENAVIMGDLEFAIPYLQQLLRRRAEARSRGMHVALTLGTLATAHLLESDPMSARPVLAEAAPVIVRYDLGPRFAASAALLAALEGRWRAAAQLLGYLERATAATGDVLHPAEAVALSRVREQLATPGVAGADAARWEEEGAALTTDAAYARALAADD